MNYFPEELHGMKILIVDDVPDKLDILSYILKKNFQLSIVNSGEKALSVLEKFDADLVLLDVMMPGLDGYETCRRMKENKNTRDIPVIFLTGKIEEEDIVKGFKIGCADYIAKPFKDVEIFSRIGAHLKIKKLIKDLSQSHRELVGRNEEIIESRNQYQFIVETVSDGIFYLDENGNIKSINQKLCVELGFDEKELLGKPIEVLVDTSEDPKVKNFLMTKRFGDRSTRGLIVKFFVKGNDAEAEQQKIKPLYVDSFGLWNVQNNVVAKINLEKKFNGSICVVRLSDSK